jgi:hypothetical protein
MAQLLIKVYGAKGLAAHIAGADGKPLCTARLKITTWRLQNRSSEGVVVCGNCRRIKERAQKQS